VVMKEKEQGGGNFVRVCAMGVEEEKVYKRPPGGEMTPAWGGYYGRKEGDLTRNPYCGLRGRRVDW